MRMSKVTKKFCRKCNVEKSIDEYYLNARGNTTWCKECLRELSRQRVKDGRDKLSKIIYEEKYGHYRSDDKPDRLTDIQLAAYEAFRNAKKRALYTNKEFTITRDDVERAVIDFCKTNYYDLSPKHPFKPSLDRISNDKGYTRDNIQILWMIENLCKNSFTEEQVLEFCRRKLGLE